MSPEMHQMLVNQIHLRKEVDKLLTLCAVILIDGKSQEAAIRLLNTAGYAPKEIAGLLATTQNTVSVTLAKLRKTGRLPRRPKGEPPHEE